MTTTTHRKELARLEFDTSVSTQGTNWEFTGTPECPSWTNTETGHQLIIDAAESSKTYRLKLNHEQQCRPFWTVTELDFAPEFIPLVEWVLSTPQSALFSREAVCHITEPFWSENNDTLDSEVTN